MTGWRGSRVVVLGGAGFLGSHVCERLLDAGAEEVVCVDNLKTSSAANLERSGLGAGFRLLRQDITAGLDVPGPADFVFNFASPASPRDYARLPIETLRVGSLGTDHGLQLAERAGAVFVQASTSEVYGDPLVHPQREDYFGNVDSVGPRAVYDESKWYAEALASAYQRTRGVRARIARIFNTYGPRMRLEDGRVVPTLIRQALRGEPFTLFGDGRQTRSFCFVDDLVQGLLDLAQSNVDQPVNLGNPGEVTMLELVEAVRQATGSNAPVRFLPAPRGDPLQRRPDISRAREWLGWSPQTPLGEGLARTVEWYRGRRVR